ncbi:MAG TPA: aminotransferase class III-fold pyridoxal phosphate-dependent enzyme, partial [Nitrospirota bacterium]|nr:aminotransferase class III-fold pyridoxal phosphate-dependent enzyme [Nitrospirota bacterium]
MSHSNKPEIKGSLPGPEAADWVRRDEQVISQSYTRAYPLVVEKGEGAIIEDVDGNQYIDFTSGIAVTATGHCHPAIVERIINQSKRLIHMSGTDFYYPSEIMLAEKLTA